MVSQFDVEMMSQGSALDLGVGNGYTSSMLPQRVRLGLITMVLMAAAGGATFAAGPESWIELRSPNFIAVTNANEKQVRRVAYTIRDDPRGLPRILQHAGLRSDPPVMIIAAKDENTLKTLLPEYWAKKGSMHPAGIFLGGPEKNYVGLRLDVSMNQEAYGPFEPVYHEYVHYLTRRMMSPLPLWMVEGSGRVLR